MRLSRSSAILMSALLALGTVTAAAGPAAAVIPDCTPGPGVTGCITFTPLTLRGQALTWNFSVPRNGLPVSDFIVAPLQANDAVQDFHPLPYGTMLRAYHNGLVSAAIASRYPHGFLWEFQYSDAADNLCLAVSSSPAQTGTPLGLQTCGTTPDLWLIFGGFEYVIASANSDSAIHLQAMTAPAASGGQVVTSPWSGIVRLDPRQLWDAPPSQ